MFDRYFQMKEATEEYNSQISSIVADLAVEYKRYAVSFIFPQIALFCFVLFCFVLFCFVLFCFVLFCFVLFCFVLFCFVLFCFVLFCFVLFIQV